MQEQLGKLNKVFMQLGDEKSKKLFLAKCGYAITDDWKIMESALREYFEKRTYSQTACKVIELSKSRGKKIVLYGAGGGGIALKEFFEVLGGEIDAFCDSNPEKWNMDLEGKKIISLEDLKEYYFDAYVIVSMFGEERGKAVKRSLVELGFQENRLLVLSDFLGVQYFDDEIIHFEKNEVFVDAGCYDLENSIDFVQCASEYSHIYAFEPNDKSYERCKRRISEEKITNIDLYSYGLWSESKAFGLDDLNRVVEIEALGKENEKNCIEVKSLDKEIGDKCKNVSYIKMDIEGSELEALKGCSSMIKEYRPKLAISIYHKPEDFYTIPLYLLSLIPNYKLYIRPYTASWNELVLYAI